MAAAKKGVRITVAPPKKPPPRRFIIVYGEPGEGGHDGGRLTQLAAATHVREIERNQFPGVPEFRRGIDETHLTDVHTVAGIVRALTPGNVAYLAYFGHAGITPGRGQTPTDPSDRALRTGSGVLYIGNGATAGANLTMRGGPADRSASDLPRARFAQQDAQVRLFGCRAGMGFPSVAQQIADHLRFPVFAYTSTGGALYTTDIALGHAQRDLTKADIDFMAGNIPDGTNVWLVPAGRPTGWTRFAPAETGHATPPHRGP